METKISAARSDHSPNRLLFEPCLVMKTAAKTGGEPGQSTDYIAPM